MVEKAPDFIRIVKLIKAPREKVYHAWIDPDTRCKWWGASPEHSNSVCEIDPKVGGNYRINMEKGDEEYVTVGEFVELDPPKKLVFTWSWEKPANGVQGSVVTVELFEVEADGNPATELVLTHEKLPDTQNRDAHTNGWTGCLAALAKWLSSGKGLQ